MFAAMSVDGALTNQEWVASEVRSLTACLQEARSSADKLAMLRSLVRLAGGRLERSELAIPLTEVEIAAAPRFGMAISNSVIRLIDEQTDVAPKGYWDAQSPDSSLRRCHEHLPPDALLLRHSSHRDFRSEGQKAAVRSLFTMPSGSALMVCLPTGSGKSLLFQIMAVQLREEVLGKCVLVITPTVSLALDHERTLSATPGLERSRALVGGMSPIERTELLDSFRRGEVPVLLMSPEIALGSAREQLVEAAKSPESKLSTLGAHLAAVFIDEAHIIENWGRSFRPDFQRLPGLVQELRGGNPDLKCILLSATLPPAARDVLRSSYRSERGWSEVDAASPRTEFDIVVQSYKTAEERVQALDFVIDRAPRPMIVYTTLAGDEDEERGPRDLRVSAAEIFERLKERGYERIALFSGEISSNTERSRIVQDWADNKIDIVVATSAFGMGVDKSNVRTVIHACLPDSPSRWYQEIGRSARDGRQGIAICLFTDATRDDVKDDANQALSMATSSWITRDKAVPRWEAMVHSAFDIRWTGAKRAMTIKLDSMRPGIKVSTDYNRRWNMSIMNLLQRARTLEVISCAQDAEHPTWAVEINEPSLLAENTSEVWDRVFALRDREQARAREEARQFVRLMKRAETTCVLRDVFELLQESADGDLPACGRCPGCRTGHQVPPHAYVPRLTAEAWPRVPRSAAMKLPTGITLIAPRNPTFSGDLSSLIHRLAQTGVEQLIAPDEIATSCAEAFAQSAAKRGFVVAHSSFLRNRRAIALVPSALLLRPNELATGNVLSVVWECRSRDALPDPLLLVAKPSLTFDGRRIDQTMSARAPYHEDALDNFAMLEPAA